MAQDKMFEEALRHIHQGERGRARDLLTRLLRANKSNVDYWIWMSSVVDSPTERIYCLESALRLDPENVAAKRGLVILGARPASDDVVPVPPIKRKWWTELEVQAEPPKSFIGKLWANPILRLVSIIVIALLTIGLI